MVKDYLAKSTGRAIVLRVLTHGIHNAPAVLFDGGYAFIDHITPFLELFYQGTLTEYLSSNPLTNSGVKLIKMDGLAEPLVQTFKQFFSTGEESWSS